MFKITSYVIRGKISDAARNLIADCLQSYEGFEIVITIGEKGKRRSNQQNAYWFGVLGKYVLPAFRESGNWSTFKLHEMLMHELGYEEAVVAPNGKIYACRHSSKEFTTKQWEDFMERARAHLAVEYQIYIPLPNEELNDNRVAVV